MEVYNTTKELILNTPVPVQTRTYKPVSHGPMVHSRRSTLVRFNHLHHRLLEITSRQLQTHLD